jgi:hypothetical protein
MEILDKESIWKTLRTLFINKSVQILPLEGGKSYPAKIGLWKDNYLTAITDAPENGKGNFLAVRYEGKLILCKCDYRGKDEKGAWIFSPAKINIREDTLKTNEEEKINPLFVSNIISMSEVTIFLGDDHIKEVIRKNAMRLKHLFDVYNVVITDKHDERVRLMKSFDQPILILNKEDPKSIPLKSVPFHEYSRLFRTDKTVNNYKSEICVPIKYRQYIIIGYVQVLHSGRLDLNSFNLVSLTASAIKKEIGDYSNFEESKEACKVININESELTFLHSLNKHFSRIFQMGTILIFDLYTKDSRLTLRGSVKAVKPLDKYFSITIQYYNLSIEQFEKIEGFIGLPTG